MSAGGKDPTFHEFASRWWFARKSELRPTTQTDREWRIRKHLLPFFHDFLVSAITIALVDEYRSEKVIERERVGAAAAAGRPIRDKHGQRRVALSNESINKTLVLLANMLDTAVEHRPNTATTSPPLGPSLVDESSDDVDAGTATIALPETGQRG